MLILFQIFLIFWGAIEKDLFSLLENISVDGNKYVTYYFSNGTDHIGRKTCTSTWGRCRASRATSTCSSWPCARSPGVNGGTPSGDHVPSTWTSSVHPRLLMNTNRELLTISMLILPVDNNSIQIYPKLSQSCLDLISGQSRISKTMGTDLGKQHIIISQFSLEGMSCVPWPS